MTTRNPYDDVNENGKIIPIEDGWEDLHDRYWKMRQAKRFFPFLATDSELLELAPWPVYFPVNGGVK
jgi:hypothetical protein